MSHCRAVGVLISLLVLAFALWVIVSDALSQVRDGSRSASRAQGLPASEQVYSVLIHPRCINCHTSGNYRSKEITANGTSPMLFVVEKAKVYRD